MAQTPQQEEFRNSLVVLLHDAAKDRIGDSAWFVVQFLSLGVFVGRVAGVEDDDLITLFKKVLESNVSKL